MLTRHIPLTIAALVLSLTAATASAVHLNYTKITYKTAPNDDLDYALPDFIGNIATPGPASSPPLFVQSIGLANNPNLATIPSGGQNERRIRVTNLGSSGQDGVTINWNDAAPNNGLNDLPTFTAYDLFNNISLPTADGNPSSNPSTIRRLEVHNLGSSGQDGVEMRFVLTDPTTGDDVPMQLDLTLASGQPLTFANIVPSFTPAAGLPDTYSSFFDIYFQLDVAPAGSSISQSLPMFQLTTTLLDTPEPTSLLLLAAASPLLLRRKK